VVGSTVLKKEIGAENRYWVLFGRLRKRKKRRCCFEKKNGY